MNLREQAEYTATLCLIGLCRLLPRRVVYALFDGFGRLFHAVSGRRRRIARANLSAAFPDMAPADRRRLAKTVFRNVAETFAFNILFLAGRYSVEEVMGMVAAADWDRFEEYLSLADRGLLIISAHLGNWELLAQYASLRSGREGNVIARESDNKRIDEEILTPFRTRTGLNVFYKRNAMLKTIKAIKRGEHVGMLIDQKSNAVEGVPVRLFGQETLAVAAPALLQMRFGAKVVPAFMVRLGRERYAFKVGEPVEWNDNGKPEAEQVAELTQFHQAIIEDAIRRWPDQWFWMHNRWRRRRRD